MQYDDMVPIYVILILDAVGFPYLKKLLICLILLLNQVIVIERFGDLLSQQMVAVGLLVIQYPEVEVAATAVPCVAVYEVLCVLPYGYPEAPVAGFEDVFLDPVLCYQLPCLVEAVSEGGS
jgi:hypothetical protein